MDMIDALSREYDKAKQYGLQRYIGPHAYQGLQNVGNLLNFVGPQADVAGAVQSSADTMEAAKRGDMLGALSGLGMTGAEMADYFIPGNVTAMVPALAGSTWFRGVSGKHPLRENTFWTNNAEEADAYAKGAALTNSGENPMRYTADIPDDLKGRDIEDEIMEALMFGDPDEVAADILAKEGLDFVEFYHPPAVGADDVLVRMYKDPSKINITSFDEVK